jgi:muramoyltetrapeptide carboxypeptidase
MNLSIEKLKPGDLIEILAPAKSIENTHVESAAKALEEMGFNVRISEHCLGRYNYFSGTVYERLHDFQKAIDDNEVRAILCARGGYGCIQLVDKLQWANMLRHPKWIIGFSDVTVFHQKLGAMGLKSIHGTMPLDFSGNSTESLSTLNDALTGKPYTIKAAHTKHNKHGSASATLRGGNLSIVYSLLGTDDCVDYTDSILFVEDLSEQIYHLDRMFYALAKAGVLNRIKGLIIGGMTDMKDTAVPFGMSYENVILSHFDYRKIPICFDFPAGHINDNRTLVLGAEVELNVNSIGSELLFL